MRLSFGTLCGLMMITQLSLSKSNTSITISITANQDAPLTCETDYWFTINCVLDYKSIPDKTDNISYWLKFDLNQHNNFFNCSFFKRRESYICSAQAKIKYQTSFADFMNFKIFLCYLKNGSEQTSLMHSTFYPAKHIKPVTPSNLSVQYGDEHFNFTWMSGYEMHEYARALPIRYYFSYQKIRNSAWKTLHLDKTSCSIAEHEFEPGAEYIAKVSSEISNTNSYDGTRSDWSIEIRWKTQSAGIPTSNILIPICLVVGLCFLLLYPVARLKIKNNIWFKTPSSYLKSFSQTCHENLQGMVPELCVQQLYSEEISTIDMIMEIKAVPSHQGNMYNMYSSTNTHTPYVCRLTDDWVPCHKSDPDIPSSDPCSDLDLHLKDSTVKEALLSLNIINPVEGSVCLDDLESSQEICQPSDSLPVTSLLGTNLNYCTLTNTAVGLIPTFSRQLSDANPNPVLESNIGSDLINYAGSENTTELVTLTLDTLQLYMEE